MTQNDFRQQMRALIGEAMRALPMVQVFEVLASSQHEFQIVYGLSFMEDRQHPMESTQESPP
jgi:hypothetical protein